MARRWSRSRPSPLEQQPVLVQPERLSREETRSVDYSNEVVWQSEQRSYTRREKRLKSARATGNCQCLPTEGLQSTVVSALEKLVSVERQILRSQWFGRSALGPAASLRFEDIGGFVSGRPKRVPLAIASVFRPKACSQPSCRLWKSLCP